MVQCCRCNGSDLCRNCCCVRTKRACTDCLPGKNSKYWNRPSNRPSLNLNMPSSNPTTAAIFTTDSSTTSSSGPSQATAPESDDHLSASQEMDDETPQLTPTQVPGTWIVCSGAISTLFSVCNYIHYGRTSFEGYHSVAPTAWSSKSHTVHPKQKSTLIVFRNA